MKKALSFIMIILIMLTLVPGEIALAATEAAEEIESILTSEKAEEKEEVSAEAVPVEKAQTAEEFNDKVSELISENDTGEYFSQIVINQQENTSSIDGNTPTEAEEALINGDVVNVKNDNAGIDIFSLLPESATQEISEAMEEKEASATETKYVPVTALEEQGYSITTNDKNEIVISNPYQTKRLIVKTQDKKALADTYGASRAICDSEGRYILQYDDTETAMNAHEKLREEKGISSVSPDHIVTVSQFTAKSSNPLTQNGRSRWGAERIESDRYKNYLSENNKSTPITVAVIDTGVDLDHPFIKDRLVPGYDFIDNDAVPDDKNMHGTHCSGIIKDNTPDNVKIMPVKVFNSDGRASDLSISLGIDYAVKNGADILNMSFGGVCEEGYVCEQESAINRAIEAGVICVAAAGNESDDTASFCPAKIRSCITVSSVDKNGALSDFSNFGESVDVAAPGEDIWSSTLDGKYEPASGTSMATPFVASAVAMLLTNNPSMTVSETEQALKKICADQGVKGNDRSYGAGIPDFGIFFGQNDKATDISIKEKSITVTVSKTVKFDPVPVTVTLTPEKATIKTYSVSVADPSVAYYNGFGFIGKKEGKTSATFSLDNGKKQTVTIICEKRTFWVEHASDSFAGGNGTKYDPYLVRTPEQLARISYMGDKCLLKADMYFKQTADIDLSGKTWYPIMGRDPEKGVTRINFDGDGYEIRNLHIADINSGIFIYYAGLFACTTGEIKNVNMINADIYMPGTDTAPICVNMGGHIENCYTSGKIEGGATGGIVCRLATMNGIGYDIAARNCRSDATVIGGDTGGIVWAMSNGTVENCIFTGKLMGRTCQGGIVATVAPIDGIAYEPDCVYGSCKIINCVSVENLIDEISYETVEFIFGLRNDYIKTASDSDSSSKELRFSMSNCYYSGENKEIRNVNSELVTIKEIGKVDGSLLKTSSFYTEKGRWHSDAPWDMKNRWRLSGSYPEITADRTAPEFSDFDYYELPDHITVTGYYGTDPEVKIPSKIAGKPVRYIDSDFNSHYADVTSVTLSDAVKYISAHAFCYRFGRVRGSLQHIDLGQVKFIGKGAFYGCVNLKTVTIPSSVEYMDAQVFDDCEILHAFFEGDANHISEKIFYTNFSAYDTAMYYRKGTKGWENYKPDGYRKKVKKKTYDPKIPVAAIFQNSNSYCPVFYGEKNKLEMIICPESASSAKLTYKSSNKNVSVNKKGILTAKKKSRVTGNINVYYNGKKIGSIPCITVYTKNLKYSIRYKSTGGKGKMSTQKNVRYSGVTLKKNTFTPPKGKVFAGWALSENSQAVFTDGQKVKALSIYPNDTVTLYAVWVTPQSNKIIYDTNGGTLSKKAKTKYRTGTGHTLTEPTKKGYTFVGWYRNRDLKGEKIEKINPWDEGTFRLYAKWKLTGYSVSFNANGGSGKMKKQTGFKYGKSKALKKNTFKAPKGKVFAGWATSKNGKAKYTDGQQVKNLTSTNGKTVKLYAVWVTPKAYKIKYNAKGGKFIKKVKKTYKSGTGTVLATPTRKGYKFVGWYTDKKCQKGKTTVIKPWTTGNKTFYAKWKKI